MYASDTEDLAMPFIDSEEDEIFFGPITEREIELRERRKLKRRTIASKVGNLLNAAVSSDQLTGDLSVAAASTSVTNAEAVHDGTLAPPSTPDSTSKRGRSYLDPCNEDEDVRDRVDLVKLELAKACVRLSPSREPCEPAVDTTSSVEAEQAFLTITSAAETSDGNDASSTSPETTSTLDMVEEIQLPKKESIEDIGLDSTSGSYCSVDDEGYLDASLPSRNITIRNTKYSLFRRSSTETESSVCDSPRLSILTTLDDDLLTNGSKICRETILEANESLGSDSMGEEVNSYLDNGKIPARFTIQENEGETFHEANAPFSSDLLGKEVNSYSEEVKIPTGFTIQENEEAVDVEHKGQANLLMQTLQRRFHQQLAEIPASLADLSLDDNSFSLVKNSMCEDSINDFLANEAACRSMTAEETSSANATSLPELQVSTVSADEDGGFLTGFTELALYHAAIHAEPKVDLSETYSVKAGNNATTDLSANTRATEPRGSDLSETYSVQVSTNTATDLSANTQATEPDLSETYSVQVATDTATDLSANTQATEPRGSDLSETYSVQVGTDTATDLSANTRATEPDEYMDEDDTRHILDVINGYHQGWTMQSQTFDSGISEDKEIEEARKTDDMNTSFPNKSPEHFNDTIEDMEMLEAYGWRYILGGKDEDFSKLDDDVDASFRSHIITKEQQLLLDSIIEEHPSAKKPVCHSEANSVISGSETESNYVPMFSQDSSAANSLFAPIAESTPQMSLHNLQPQNLFPTVSDVSARVHAKRDGQTGVQTDFKFTKPLSKVTKASYQRETTPVKPLHLTKPTGKIFRQIVALSDSKAKVPISQIPHKSPVLHKPKYFSKIESPVGAYIHSSPASLISNKIPSYADSGKKRKFFPDVAVVDSERSSENTDTNNIAVHSVIPVVSYKSTSSLKLDVPSKTHLPHLDEKMKCLIDKPRLQVIKHLGRVKESDLPEGSLLERAAVPVNVFENSSLANDSCFALGSTDEASSRDVSLVVRKDVARTNTLPR